MKINFKFPKNKLWYFQKIKILDCYQNTQKTQKTVDLGFMNFLNLSKHYLITQKDGNFSFVGLEPQVWSFKSGSRLRATSLDFCEC